MAERLAAAGCAPTKIRSSGSRVDVGAIPSHHAAGRVRRDRAGGTLRREEGVDSRSERSRRRVRTSAPASFGSSAKARPWRPRRACAQALGVGDSVRFMGLIPRGVRRGAGERPHRHPAEPRGVERRHRGRRADGAAGVPGRRRPVATRHADIPAVAASADEPPPRTTPPALQTRSSASPSYRRTPGWSARQGRDFVETHHAAPVVAARLAAVYREAAARTVTASATTSRSPPSVRCRSRSDRPGRPAITRPTTSREWAEIWREYRRRIRPAPYEIEFSDGTSALLPLSLETAPRARSRLPLVARTPGGWTSKHTLTTTHAALLAYLSRLGPLAVESLRSHCPRPPPSGCALRHDANAAADRRLRLGDGFDALRGPDGMAKGERAGVRVRTAESGRDWKAYYEAYRSVGKVGKPARRRAPGCSSPRCTAASRRESAFGSWSSTSRGRRILCLYSDSHVNWHGAALATFSACAP